MKNKPTSFVKTKASKIIFFLSIIVLLFWVIGNLANIYHFSIAGVVFEILWLPVVILTFTLPILSLACWMKEKFNLHSLNLHSTVMGIVTILFVLFVNSSLKQGI